MLSDRDKTRLVGVHPKLIARLSDVSDDMERAGIPIFVVEGVRTAARQAQLYAQGRTASGPIVTYRDGIRLKSNHQPHSDGYGYAVDCAFIGSAPFDPSHPWEAYGEAAENHGLVWGGRWEMHDLPHVEMLDESTVRVA